MAGISFEDAVAPTKSSNDAPSKGISFEDAVSKVDVRGFGDKEPPKTTGLGTFVREAGLNVPATMVGIGAGEFTTAVTAPVLGPAAPVAGLVVGGATAFGVNYLGEAGMDELEAMGPVAQKIMQTLGVDKATREAGRKEHEYYALSGQLASGGPFMSTAAKNVGQRLVGGGINVGVGGGTRAAFGEDQDIKKSAIEFVAGFTTPGTLSKTGERIPGVRKTEPTTTKKPTTPEQIDAFKAKIKEEKAKRDAKAPLVEAAIRNKETGEIERMGPKHDEARKAETVDTHEQGFVDERDNFHTREAAVDQAKRAGQLPEDHVLEIPEDGLHSGDLRKAGDERFAITEDQPAGTPKPPAEEPKAPVTRQEHKDAIGKLEEQAYMDLELQRQEAHNTGDTKAAAEIEAQQAKIEQQIADLRKSMPGVDFKNKALPTWEELHDHLDGARSVGEAFDRILSTDGLGTKGQRALLTVLNKSEFIRDASLSYSKDYLEYVDENGKTKKNAAGLYTGGDQHLVQLAKDGDIRVLAHEAMHAGTQRLIDMGNSVAATKLKDLQEKFLAEHNRRYQEALEQFQRDNIAPTIGELKAFEKANRQPYGFTNAHEFVAEAFTKRDFKEILASIKSTEPGTGVLSNMWQEFKNIVREGLNIPEGQRTAFDDVLEYGAALVEESKGFKRDSSGTITLLPSKLSEEIHDQLQREGIPVAHTSPHKFDEPNWIKYALTGEGTMWEGAGFYLSTGNKVNKYYWGMSKRFLRDKLFNENSKLRTVEGTLKIDANVAKNERNASIKALKAFEDNEVVRRAQYEASRTFDDYINDANEWYERLDPNSQEAKLEYKEHIEARKQELDEALKEETKLKDALSKSVSKSIAANDKLEAFYKKIDEQTKASTYHFTLEAKPEELIDWNSTTQSKLVSKAFDKLGIDKDNLGYFDKEDGWVKFTGEELPTGEELYRELSKKLKPVDEVNKGNLTEKEASTLGDIKASIALMEQGVVGHVYNAHGGEETQFRNYVAYDTKRLKQNAVTLASKAEPKDTVTTSSKDELATKTSEPVAKAFEKVDPRSVPNEEEMIKHATDIHERFGEAEAIKFFEDYKKDLNERSIPVPNNKEQLEDAFHKVSTFATKDRSEHTVGYNKTSIGDLGERPSILNPIERNKWDKEAARRLKEMNELREAAFLVRENGGKVSGELGKVLDAIDAENIALVRKIKAMGGDVGEEFVTGQSRIRMFSEKEKPGWKETIKNFFDNNAPMGDKVADQVNSAIERKVYQTDDGRVIEFHRQPKDVTTPKGEIKQGTQIFEWKNKQKRLIGSSDDINFKRGDKFTVNGKELTVVDGKVPEIEKHSTYKYWHDAEASARIANMDLRKMARELELMNNLKQSELFKQFAHGPDQDIKDLPKHYVQPENIGLIPQLDGWKFDPKTAAIINDFAKVWDNTMWMKATNALVKNMMLNPVPHMFNEVMHLWVARGFTGWVDPRQLATFADTARVAWRDVVNQTQFYRDIMREGASVQGADPRNNKYFQAIQKEAQKQMFETPEMQRSMGQLAKKLGTSVGDLYNGISNASQKAMWFTRDVMYVQYIREIMIRQEKSTGVKMELKDAIAQAERHMPNYRMSSEVLNSRTIAEVLKNPNIALFSRYHYGMVKSLVNTIKDIDPRNLKTPEGRAHFREGVDSMIAIGVAMGVLYPLMDAMASAVFGKDAEQRRAGPFHLLQAGVDVYEGKKDLSALIYPVFTFNPVLLTLGQLGFNKKLFTGKNIYNMDDSIENIAGDIGTYAVKQLPQAAPIMSATAEEEGDTKLLARQFDIKVETEAEKKRKERALKAKAQKKKTRDTQRAKGTYNP